MLMARYESDTEESARCSLRKPDSTDEITAPATSNNMNRRES